MLSSNVKYIGLDVHKEATTVAVRNAAGKLVMESIVETKARTLIDLLDGLRGELHVTLEEGTWAAWLYDVLKPHVRNIVVCNQLRLYFSALAYTLMEALRRLGLKGTAWAEAQVDTIRVKLLKIGAIVRVSVRRVLLQLSSAYPWKDLYIQAFHALRC